MLFRELVAAIPYKYPLPLSFLTPFFATRQLVDSFVSVLFVSVLPEEEFLKFSFKEVMLGYLAL